MRKTLWIIGAVIAIGVLWWILRSGENLELPQLPLPGVSEEDTAGKIQQDLEQIDLGDIDKEFESIDADLNNL